MINQTHTKMKKVLSIMAVAAVMLFAGKSVAQVTIHAGYQLSSIQEDYNVFLFDHNASGFYVGADYDIPFQNPNFGIAPGIEFSYFKDMVDVRVPILFNWKMRFDTMNFGIFAGPVLNIGVEGDLYKDHGTNKTSVAVDGGVWLGYKRVLKQAIALTFSTARKMRI
jgi:hypothetical protein